MMTLRETVLFALQQVTLPETEDNVVSAGLVRALTVSKGTVHYVLDGVEQSGIDVPALKGRIEKALMALEGVERVDAVIAGPAPEGDTSDDAPRPLAGVGKVILVGSGKGGVGKSTVAANLALACAARGLRTGLLDADLYGPSQPRIFGTEGRPVSLEDTLIPIATQGVQLLSIGSMIAPGHALLWRGAGLHETLSRMIFDTRWAPLDVLLIDLPPGTGDVPLSILQQLQVTGAILVSTPQDLSLEDVRRALDLFQRTETHVLGLVENMALHKCSTCGTTDRLFGPSLENFAHDTGIPYLGALPLSHQISLGGDARNAGSDATQVIDFFDEIASTVVA